jgi:hypothetical protein
VAAVVRILLYSNRKVDPMAWDASTPEKKAAAFLALFEYLRDDWEVYADLQEPQPWDVDKPSRQRVLFQRAVAGDAEAAEALLTMRKKYEYEYWSLIDAVDAREAREQKKKKKR